MKWETVSGVELERALASDNGLDEILQRVSAIYLWRRSLVPPAGAMASRTQFEEWLTQSLAIPFAQVDKMQLTHFCELKGLSLGGGPLTAHKADTLAKLLRTERGRDFLKRFLRSLNQYVPPLYAGEARDIVVRIREHLTDQTDFAQRLKDRLRLGWSDLELCYLKLPPAAPAAEGVDDTDRQKDLRTLFELIAARTTFAGYTSRPG